MELKNIIDAYLSPDKKKSLADAVAAIPADKLDDVIAQARKRSQELGAKGSDISQDELAEVESCTEIMLAATEVKAAERAKTEKAEADTAAAEARAKRVAELEQKQAAIAAPKSESVKAAVDESTDTNQSDGGSTAVAVMDAPAVEDPQEVAAAKELTTAAFRNPVQILPTQRSNRSDTAEMTPSGKLTNAFRAFGAETDENRLLTMDDVTKAVMEQVSAQGSGAGLNTSTKVVKFKKSFSEEFVLDELKDDDSKIDALVKKFGPTRETYDRRQGQFAAGWCAPSENLYELCDFLTSLDGIWNVPEMVANRGGVNYTTGPDFAAIFANAAIGQRLTEAQVIAATTKTCIEIDCPPFTPRRLDVNPLCVTGNLLTEAGYPEYNERFIRTAIAANEHKVSGLLLADAVTASTAVDASTGTTGVSSNTATAGNLIDWASFYAMWLRQQYRTRMDQIVEVVAPHHLYQSAASDLMWRTGVDLLTAGNRINEMFAAHNIRVQWVYNWQSLNANPSTAKARAATAQILVYLPGTFVKLTKPVINLGVLHSAAQLATNQYTALFVEEGFALIERCYQSLVVTVPVCASGMTGAASGTCDATP